MTAWKCKVIAIISPSLLILGCSRSPDPINGDADVKGTRSVQLSQSLPWGAGMKGKFGCKSHGADDYKGTKLYAYDFSAIGEETAPNLLASADGKIRKINRSNTTGASCFQDVGAGRTTFNACWTNANYVIFSFKENPAYEAVYFHLESVNPELQEGQDIVRGTYIGKMGRSGYADGAHLHYHVQAIAEGIWNTAGSVFVSFDEFNGSGITNGLGNDDCFDGGWFDTPVSQNRLGAQPATQNGGPAAPVGQNPPIQDPTGGDGTPQDPVDEEPVDEDPVDDNPEETPQACARPDAAAIASLTLSEPTFSQAAARGRFQVSDAFKLEVRKLMGAACYKDKAVAGGRECVTQSAADQPGGSACLGWVISQYSGFCDNGSWAHANFSTANLQAVGFTATCPR